MGTSQTNVPVRKEYLNLILLTHSQHQSQRSIARAMQEAPLSRNITEDMAPGSFPIFVYHCKAEEIGLA
jgi:hypothetical protein